MYGWMTCPFCHHNHLPQADGHCPRCEQRLTAGDPPPVAVETETPSVVMGTGPLPIAALTRVDLPPHDEVEAPVVAELAPPRSSGWATVTRWVGRAVMAAGAALGVSEWAKKPPQIRFFHRYFGWDALGEWDYLGARPDWNQLVLTGAFVTLGLAWMACAYFTASSLAERRPVFSLRRLLLSWIPGYRPSSVTILHVTRKLASLRSGVEKDRRWLLETWWVVTLLWAAESLFALVFGGTHAGMVLAKPAAFRLDLLLSLAQHALTMLVVHDVGKELVFADRLRALDGLLVPAPPPSATPARDSAPRWKQLPAPIPNELVEAPVDPECVACGHLTESHRCPECGSALWAGAYRIIRLLGQRPHSRTYLALNEQGTRVVLKELSFSLAPNAVVIDAFEREAALLRALQHPQIPRFVDSFAEGTGVGLRFYLAQEFVHGRSLQEELAQGRLAEAETKAVLRDLLPVLRHLHEQSPAVIHRDIKPSNIMRRYDGTLMLIDFGAARAIGHTLMDATLVGTFGYMPPQQLAGQVDPSADLYALGATAVHLVTGRPPWELIQDDLRFELPKSIPLSRPFTRYLQKLVAPQRRQRFPSAAAALDALPLNLHERRLFR